MGVVQWGVGAALLASLAVVAWAVLHRRVRVRVRPVRLEARGSRALVGLGIEIRNVSGFPVTISEVGYMRPDGSRAPIVPAVTLQKQRLPARIEPGAQVTVRGDLGEADLRVLSHAHLAYAVTSCGKRATGTSLDLRQAATLAGRLF